MLTCYRNSSLIVYPLFSRVFPIRAVSGDCDVRLAVECLDCMMRKRRQVSIQRVLGFVKRLSTLSSQLLPGACLAVMATIKRFIQVSRYLMTHTSSQTHTYHTKTYSQCEQLLDVEESATGGVFRPDVPDPEVSHASSTALWELPLLRVSTRSQGRTFPCLRILENNAWCHGF